MGLHFAGLVFATWLPKSGVSIYFYTMQFIDFDNEINFVDSIYNVAKMLKTRISYIDMSFP